MRMGRVSGIPRKHAQSLQRRPSLAFSYGTYYRGSRRPLYRQSRQRLPFSPTVWASFGNSACAKNQASLLHDGLLRKIRHSALITCLELLEYYRNRGPFFFKIFLQY
jgi:hypothetical protein